MLLLGFIFQFKNIICSSQLSKNWHWTGLVSLGLGYSLPTCALQGDRSLIEKRKQGTLNCFVSVCHSSEQENVFLAYQAFWNMFLLIWKNTCMKYVWARQHLRPFATFISLILSWLLSWIWIQEFWVAIINWHTL